MNGTEKRKIIYWDACIYIAWLVDEEAIRGKGHMDGIRQSFSNRPDMRGCLNTCFQIRTLPKILLFTFVKRAIVTS